MKEERDDAKYFREFFEISKKKFNLKSFLFKKQGLSKIDESDG